MRITAEQAKNRVRSFEQLNSDPLLTQVWHGMDLAGNKVRCDVHSIVATCVSIYQHDDLREKLIELAKEAWKREE